MVELLTCNQMVVSSILTVGSTLFFFNMRKPKIKSSDFNKLRKVIKIAFNDGQMTGKYARKTKEFFGEVIINSL